MKNLLHAILALGNSKNSAGEATGVFWNLRGIALGLRRECRLAAGFVGSRRLSNPNDDATSTKVMAMLRHNAATLNRGYRRADGVYPENRLQDGRHACAL